jgi:hypothetical protein
LRERLKQHKQDADESKQNEREDLNKVAEKLDDHLQTTTISKQNNLHSTSSSSSSSSSSSFVVGDIVEALWLADNKWYKAKIDSIQKDGNFDVTFTEYGNSQPNTTSDQIRSVLTVPSISFASNSGLASNSTSNRLQPRSPRSSLKMGNISAPSSPIQGRKTKETKKTGSTDNSPQHSPRKSTTNQTTNQSANQTITTTTTHHSHQMKQRSRANSLSDVTDEGLLSTNQNVVVLNKVKNLFLFFVLI